MIHRKKAAPKPPMGWNSWDCYGAAVNEEILLQNAKFISENLLPFGWEYVVCDIQWYEPAAIDTNYNSFAPLCMDEFSRLMPAPNRFPSAAHGAGFTEIAGKIHDMGLKFGIHIMRGIPRQAVHQNTKIKGSNATAREIAAPYSICAWNTDMYGLDTGKEGAQAYYDSLFELYASWGVDFVKVDDICNTEFLPQNPYSAKKEIECIRRALDRCGRSMVLSLSPGPATIENAWHLAANADMWRMTGDFWDDWSKLNAMFRRCELWYSHVGNGCWPDCDMLPLGTLCVSDRKTGARPCRLTKDEQITLMNLWCIFRSPLMLGSETTKMDEFTISLLTNRQLLEVNQKGEAPHPVISEEREAVWLSNLPENRMAVALFNREDTPRKVEVRLEELGISGVKSMKEVHTKEKSCPSEKITAALRPHASALYILSL